MNFRRTSVLIVGVIVLSGLAMLLQPLDRSYAVFFEEAGYVDTGTKFNLTVGMNSQTARTVALESGWRPLEEGVTGALVAGGWRCGGRQIQSSDEVQMYRENSWRNGLLCIFEEDGTVTGIGWSFSPLTLP